ncbi:hypothetical protein FEM33_15175 [Dyadobacter flavalbus]|uniref:VCBS repeat-containing protein n=1 Tax=Dyadobacter flavalbus TaxID=2579942 RepID=A0A5M8QUE7_9BACT|nr:hypothetical protein [Dyadobacter flavalbus]KAA6438911.1 hypothetical protein FEM33_15175 [Dyadobacter flavalbus]
MMFCMFLQHNQPATKQDVIRYKKLLVSGDGDTLRFSSDDLQVSLIDVKEKGIKVLSKAGSGVVQHFSEPTISIESCPDTAFAADLNDDGRLDFKILFNFKGASPLASRVKRKMYLFSEPDGSYSKVSFFDFSVEPETDFNGDHQFEIVAKDLVQFKKHSYWKYEVFEYSGKKLRNVSYKYGYPKLVPYRIKPVNKPLSNLADADRRKLMSKQPREYDQQ